MKYCEDLDIQEVEPGRPALCSSNWPTSIRVKKELLDYPPGLYVRFGRRTLNFECCNGYAVYQQAEHIPEGWTYRLIESEHRRT